MRTLGPTGQLGLAIGSLAAVASLALVPAAAQASPDTHASTGAAVSSWTGPSGSSYGRTPTAATGVEGKIDPGAERASDTYATGSAEICSNQACSGWHTTVSYAVTWNGSNVWINGTPKCSEHGTSITWCGYGDNGQKVIGIGDNFGTSGQWQFRIYVSDNGSCSYYFTLGVYAGGQCA